MMVKLFLFIVAIPFLSGCASLPPLPPATGSSSLQELPNQPLPLTDAATALTLAPEDVLRIDVFEHPDLSQQVSIGTDGSFVYPLIGQVQAANLTVQQLEQHMTQRLAQDYLVNPQLSITVTQHRSRHVYVLGAVRAPGIYPLKYNSTLLELISEAGGPTAEAGSYALLVRGSRAQNGDSFDDGQLPPDATRVDLEGLLAGELRQSIQVDSNNTIYVPKRAFYFVSGEVQRPGRYLLEKNTTARKAIILAGGFSQYAAKRRIKIRRLVEGQPQEFRVSMDDYLQPEDVLIIPESVF